MRHRALGLDRRRRPGAATAGADYLGVGAVFATGSKDDIDDEEYAVGTDRVAAIADAWVPLRRPVERPGNILTSR